MTALESFHFLRPWWLLAGIGLPFIAMMWRRMDGPTVLRRLVDPRLMPYLVAGGRRRGNGLLIGALLAWTLATLAMAGPSWQRVPEPVFASRSAQVIAVSMSRRMLAQDLAPDRLSRVRYKIMALLDANKAGQNGLVAYAGASFTVAPLTRDADALDALVQALAPDTMPVPGDNTASGIRRATRLLADAGMHHGSIVVIDDHADSAALKAAREAHARGYTVSVLGAGTTKGAPYPGENGTFATGPDGRTLLARRDDASLRALARAGGGDYVPMTPGAADIHALAAQLPRHDGVVRSARASTHWRDAGYWLLLPLLILAVLGFRRGMPMLLAVFMFAGMPSLAHASGWRDAWLTPDQQAARALAQGHLAEAARLAHNPALRGTALYRDGDYEKAARAFARAPGAVNRYNLGNALARLHRYKQAIAAYDQALAQDPNLADARINRKAILDWLDKHRKNKPQQGGTSKHHARAHSSGAGKQGQKGAGSGGKQGGSTSGSSQKENGAKGKQGQKPDSHARQSTSAGQGAASAGNGSSSTSREGKQAPDRGQPSHGQAASGAQPGHAASAGEQVRLQQAIGKQIDSQMAHVKPYNLGQAAQAAGAQGKRLPAAMLQALQQVPDDPGGLLRNKFMLEYQRRMQREARMPPADTQRGGP